MKTRTLGLVAAFAACLTLGGCITNGTKFDAADIQTLIPGVSTQAEAIERFGQPTATSTYGDGTVLLQWMWSEVVYTAGEGRHLAVLFDQNGKMIRITHQSRQVF